MGWLSYRVRADARTRWRALLALALFVAVVGGVVLTAAAGARRTQTAVERLSEAGRDPTLFIDASETDESKWDRIDDLPSVDVAVPLVQAYAFPDEFYIPFLASDQEGVLGHSIARGVLVAGRRPRPGAADEIALSEATARDQGLKPGSTLDLGSVSPEGAEAFDESEDAEQDGPRVRMRIVGIVRATQDLAAREGDITLTVLPTAFVEEYDGQIAMRRGAFLVRLHDGRGGVEEFDKEIRTLFAGGPAPAADPGADLTEALSEATSVQAVGLAAFAGVFLLFGLAAIAQAMSRTVHNRAGDHAALASMGMTGRGRFLDAAVPAMVAAGAGCVGAVAIAIAASPLLPVGLARRAEPNPGVSFDAGVLLLGAAVLLILVVAATAWPAWRLSRRQPDATAAAATRSRASLADRLVRTGRPAMAVGIGMAARRGRGATEVAVRTALVGVLLGATGLAATVVFSESLQRLLDSPSRYGWTWGVAASAEPEPVAQRSDTLAVADGVFNQFVQVAGETVHAFGFEVIKGRIDAPVADGRGPVTRNEVALGAALRSRLGGARQVRIDAGERAGTFTVVGTAISPSVDDAVALDTGVLLTLEGLERLGLREITNDSNGFGQTLITFRPGVDVAEAAKTLPIEEQNDRRVTYPVPPPEVNKLDQVRDLPRLLALFLGGLAIVAVLHALVQTVQRRRAELGVLRAIGFTRQQVAAVIGWQAAALALVGGIVGLPLGVAVGRWVWTAVAEGLGVAPRPEVVLLLLLVVPAAVAVAAVVGVILGRATSRSSAAVALRTE